MNYKRIHDLIIKRGQQRSLIPETGFEIHHIIMKSLGGSNNKINLVKLTIKEHRLIHELLYKINPCKQTAAALHFVNYSLRYNKNFNNKTYEKARLIMAKNMKGINNPFYGKKHTKETKLKISLILKYNEFNGMYGKQHTEESKRKMSINRIGKYSSHLKGKQQTNEMKLRISNTLKNKPPLECPHCLKVGKGVGMYKFHFKNCKQKVA